MQHCCLHSGSLVTRHCSVTPYLVTRRTRTRRHPTDQFRAIESFQYRARHTASSTDNYLPAPKPDTSLRRYGALNPLAPQPSHPHQPPRPTILHPTASPLHAPHPLHMPPLLRPLLAPWPTHNRPLLPTTLQNRPLLRRHVPPQHLRLCA